MFPVFQYARKGLRLLSLAAVAATLAACDAIPTAGTGGPGGDPVQVALLVPSGSGRSTDDFLARSLENAARLAIRDLNGAQVDLRVYQTAGDASLAGANADKAVNEGAEIIIGPVYAAAANAAGRAVAGRGVSVLSFSNNAAVAGGNLFVLGPTFDNTARRMTDFAVAQGKQRFVVVSSADAAGQQGRDAIVNAVAARGASTVATVSYALSQQDVIAAIPQIKNAVESTGADAVFFTTDSATALPLLTQLLPEAGISSDVAQFVGLTRWDIPPQTLSLPGVQNGWFAIPDQSAMNAFSGKYQAAYGEAPHPVAGLAFDAVAAIGALQSQGGTVSLSPAALAQGAGYRGASGIFRLNADGTNSRGLAVATISDAQVRIISPAPQNFGGTGF